MKKILSIIVCTVICLSTLTCVAKASDQEVTPFFNNTARVVTNFDIENGIGTVTSTVIGYEGFTNDIIVTTKIQQKFLLFFWRDVDIGVSGNQWVDTSTDVRFTCSHSVSLPSGTYRAVVTYTVYGTGGEPDVITEYAEASH